MVFPVKRRNKKILEAEMSCASILVYVFQVLSTNTFDQWKEDKSNIVSSFLVDYSKDLILFFLSDLKCHFYVKVCTSVNMLWKMTAIH